MRIINARVIGPDKMIPCATVTLSNGRIEAVETQPREVSPSRDDYDARGGTLLPGFIDLHNHGALGHDTMAREPDHWRAMCGFLASQGVTGFLPTATAAKDDEIAAYIECAKAMMAESPAGSRILGVHLEGPYLNLKYRGMHPMGHCRLPDPAEYMPWLASGVVRRITAALEIDADTPRQGACLRLLADCVAAGVCVSLGHSACVAEDVTRWSSLGLRHCTHLYNAMSRAEKAGPVRVCGCLEGVLVTDGVTAKIIGDGNHVPEYSFRVAERCKGSDGITIASDATLFTGAVQEGVPMRYGGSSQEVVVRNGRATSPDGSSLIGSIATLGEMFPRILDWLDGDWIAAARVFSTNAAGLIGLGNRKGRIQPGYDADLVLLDKELRVAATWVEGETASRETVT